MPVTSTEISKYGIAVGSDGEPTKLAASISLFDVNGKAIATWRFYPSGSALAPNEFRADLGMALVSCPVSTLPAVVDVLRNEKPLYFTWYDYPTSRFGAIQTSREPVGETEPA